MRHVVKLLAACAVLAGCSDTWLGEAEDPPLPGERISILSAAEGIKVDAELSAKAIALPEPVSVAAWPQVGGNPAHVMGHLELPAEPRRVWQTSIGSGNGDRSRLLSPPVVVDGTVFTIDSKAVVSAFDAGNGNRLWQTSLAPEEEEEGNVGGGIAVADGRVYAATGFAEVVAIDAADGAVLWRQRVSAPLRGAPTVADGRVFAVSIDNRTHALSAQDGRTLWEHAGLNEIASLLGGASPAVGSGVVLVPYSSGELYALRAENGSALWVDSLASLGRTNAVARMTDIRALPVMAGGRVFVIGNSNMFAAIDLRTGRRIWEAEAGGFETPWMAGEVLFVLTNDARLAAVDAASGKAYWAEQFPRWKNEKDKTGPVIWRGPVLAGERLVMANSQGDVLFVSPTDGKTLSKASLPGGAATAPVVAAGTAYFLTNDGELVAFR